MKKPKLEGALSNKKGAISRSQSSIVLASEVGLSDFKKDTTLRIYSLLTSKHKSFLEFKDRLQSLSMVKDAQPLGGKARGNLRVILLRVVLERSWFIKDSQLCVIQMVFL
jgi:hypothetical protein